MYESPPRVTRHRYRYIRHHLPIHEPPSENRPAKTRRHIERPRPHHPTRQYKTSSRPSRNLLARFSRITYHVARSRLRINRKYSCRPRT